MNSNPNLMRFVCPAIAVLATVVALFAPWFTDASSITDHVRTTTLLEVIQGDSFVEYTSSRWLWISGVGALLVIASALVNDEMRKKLAEAGSYLMVVLPGWSLFQVYVGDEDFGAGWGMWVVAVLAVAVIILARMIPEPAQPVVPHIEQPRDESIG